MMPTSDRCSAFGSADECYDDASYVVGHWHNFSASEMKTRMMTSRVMKVEATANCSTVLIGVRALRRPKLRRPALAHLLDEPAVCTCEFPRRSWSSRGVFLVQDCQDRPQRVA
jgi:hypothetical protein